MTDALRSLSSSRPTLYGLADDGRSLDFFYAKCPRCGDLSFPANAPGCMHCGEALDAAERVVRPGGGTLREYVTVHVPLVPGMHVPAIVGDIELAPGIVEEGVIGANDEDALRPGQALRAVAVPMPDGQTFGCRFIPGEEGAQR